MSYIQRVQLLASNHHVFFATLTYNQESLPTITTSTGVDIHYADIRDFQNMIKRIRVYNQFERPFLFFAVSERGSTNSRPHFHALFFLQQFPNDKPEDIISLEHRLYKVVFKEWRRNYGSKRKPLYKPLFTYKEKYVGRTLKRNFDFHYVKPLDGLANDSVAWYCMKYMLKPSEKEQRLQQALRLNLPPEEYETIWSMARSRCFFSKHFGDDISYVGRIRSGIDLSKSAGTLYPCFYTLDGKSFPLSRYFKSKAKFYTLEDALAFKKNQRVTTPDLAPISRDRHISELLSHERILENRSAVADKDTFQNEDL